MERLGQGDAVDGLCLGQQLALIQPGEAVRHANHSGTGQRPNEWQIPSSMHTYMHNMIHYINTHTVLNEYRIR